MKNPGTPLKLWGGSYLLLAAYSSISIEEIIKIPPTNNSGQENRKDFFSKIRPVIPQFQIW